MFEGVSTAFLDLFPYLENEGTGIMRNPQSIPESDGLVEVGWFWACWEKMGVHVDIPQQVGSPPHCEFWKTIRILDQILPPLIQPNTFR